MANIPHPAVSTVPRVLTGVLHGTVSNNQCDLLIQVKNAWKAAGWTVRYSFDGNTLFPSSDGWVDYTSILGASGGGGLGGSWIVLANPWNARQVCLYCTVSSLSTGWAEIRVVLSPAAGFTGGTTSARPTATDELPNSDSTMTAWLGTGPVGNPQFYAFTWVASDGSYLRTAWIYAGHLKSFWHWESLQTVPDGWTNNAALGSWKWGNTDYTIVGNKATTSSFTTNWGSGGSYKQVLVPATPDTSLAVNGSLESSPGSLYVPDQVPLAVPFSNQFIWINPLGFISDGHGTAAQNMFLGYTLDNWWTVPGFNDLDTMGDNWDFVIFNQMVLQWGLGDIASKYGLASASTNYPTARWYGRTCICEGGDVAIKFFDAGIASLVGDALALKKNLLTSGNVYFVNNSATGASDANTGLDRLKPKATTASAYAAASAGDIIALLSGHAETIATVITVAKAGLKIVGDGQGSNRPRLTCGLGAATPMIDITAASVMLTGVYFPASTTVTGIGRVRVGAAGVILRNSYFECGANDTTRTVGIVTGAAQVFIQDTTFAVTAATPSIAIEVVNAVSGLFMDGVIIDGGSYGWTDFALKGSAAVTSMNAGVRIMNGSNVSFPTGTTGMFFQDIATAGECRVEWTP